MVNLEWEFHRFVFRNRLAIEFCDHPDHCVTTAHKLHRTIYYRRLYYGFFLFRFLIVISQKYSPFLSIFFSVHFPTTAKTLEIMSVTIISSRWMLIVVERAVEIREAVCFPAFETFLRFDVLDNTLFECFGKFTGINCFVGC